MACLLQEEGLQRPRALLLVLLLLPLLLLLAQEEGVTPPGLR
jgi:hypothetical protein